MDVSREFFDRCVQAGTTVRGMVYGEELAGREGMDVILLPPEGTDPEAIAACREALYTEHDIVELRVRHVPACWYSETAFVPGPDRGWLEAARWIVEHRCCRRVEAGTGQLIPEDRRGGILLDLYSASAMVQVYEAISETNRARLAAMPLPVAHHMVFSVLAKAG